MQTGNVSHTGHCRAKLSLLPFPIRRREFVASLSCAGLLKAGTVLDVAYAGSMTSVMEGPIRGAAAAELRVTLQGRAQGASGLAQLIAGGSIRPDIFISITPGPMKTVLDSGRASTGTPIARTEMVIAYSPKSRFAARFRAAGKSGGEPWFRILKEPNLRFGRTDPITDPQGRNILFLMELAAQLYREPSLRRRVLGPDLNPRQIFTESSVEARLQTGELDAASAYKIQPASFQLPYIALPEEINLADARRLAEYRRVSLVLNGQTYRPEPLVYYAAALNDSARRQEAVRFVQWLGGGSAQAILRRAGYDPAGEAIPLKS